MTAHTKHPVAAPPAPPVREKTGVLLLRAWCAFVLFAAVAGTSWVMALGAASAFVVTVASAAVSIVVWVVVRPAVQWRRLPWFALAYVAAAVLSIAWSAWTATSALTALLLLITTLQGLFVGAMLTWREMVDALASALKWVLGLSILFELAVSLVWQRAVLPGFVVPEVQPENPIVYWSRDNLFDGGRIQGLFGNANSLAYASLLAIVVFAILFAARAPRRGLLVAWTALAAFLFLRAGSATAYLAAVGVAVVLTAILLMRTTRRPARRTRWYLLYTVAAVGGLTVLWLLREQLFALLGRSSDLTGREGIWQSVLERAEERPLVGWGFASPWMPWDPAFEDWIVDHGQTVMQAHNMWLDVYLQLGALGLVLMGLTYLAYVWRSWFFAVDRPRWDLRADRPYSALSLLPSLTAAILLVQGLAESGPLILWGWLCLVAFAFKIKQAPHVGEGPAEHRTDFRPGRAAKRST